MSLYIIACGGTGGHLFPGLAVAEQLRAAGQDAELWLSGRGVEQCALNDAEREKTFVLGSRPMPPRHPRAALAGFAANLKAFAAARRRIRESAPAALLAMGSYSSLPPALAARSLKIPLVLHEANAVPGRAVALLSRLAACTAVSFEETARFLPGRRTVLTGMPVRKDIVAAREGFAGRPPDRPTLLVMGGSQGAQAVNALSREALLLLRNRSVPFQVVHLCGARDEASLRRTYAEAGIPARVFGFLREIGRAYASADLVVSRAGAASCAELRARGLPALLIPLPSAARDHQHANARILARTGGAKCLPEASLSPEKLAEALEPLLRDATRRERMAAAMKTPAAADADIRLAERLMEEGR